METRASIKESGEALAHNDGFEWLSRVGYSSLPAETEAGLARRRAAPVPSVLACDTVDPKCLSWIVPEPPAATGEQAADQQASTCRPVNAAQPSYAVA